MDLKLIGVILLFGIILLFFMYNIIWYSKKIPKIKGFGETLLKIQYIRRMISLI